MPRNGKSKATVTLAKVADYAGVSKSAASEALSGNGGSTTKVSAETAGRIRAAAAALGYKPSFIGRALSTGRNYMAGLLLPSRELLDFRFYMDIISGMLEGMEKDDYNILLLFRNDSFSYMKVVEQGKIDGMFILQSDREMKHIERIAENGIPSLVVNTRIDEKMLTPNLGCICCDNWKFAKDVLDDFQSQGRTCVLAIHDHSVCDNNIQFFEAFNAELATRSLSGETVIPVKGEAALRRQFLDLLRSGKAWDGVFIDDTALAGIFVSAAKECGIDAGNDITLITTATVKTMRLEDHSEYSFYHQQGSLMGREAWREISSMLNGKPAGTEISFIPYCRHSERSPNHAHA